MVIVIEDFPVSDHMPLQFLLPPLASRPSPVRISGNKLPKFFDQVDWNPNFKPLYQERVETLIDKVFIPDSLDAMDSSPSLTINCIYFELIHCLKYGAVAVFPTNRIRLGAQKPFWSLNPFLVNSIKVAKQAYWEWRAFGKPRDSHPAFLLIKKRKAEFQEERHRHNSLIMGEASSNIDDDKDKNLLWKVLRGNRRTNRPNTNSTPSLKEWKNCFSKLSTSHDSNSVVLQLDERLKNCSTDYRISEDMLCKAIITLKAQSAKDHDGIFSNHLKLASSSFLITLLALSTFYLLLV